MQCRRMLFIRNLSALYMYIYIWLKKLLNIKIYIIKIMDPPEKSCGFFPFATNITTISNG